MIQHARIWVDGVEWSNITIASLKIDGGRDQKTSFPDATTMGATVHIPENFQPPRLGARVDVKGWLLPHSNAWGLIASEANSSRALFSGTITDLALEGDILSFVAADPTPQLQGIYIGDTPWLGELWNERMAHIWDGLRAAAGNPGWMPAWAAMWAQFFMPVWNYAQLARDVDRQAGVDLLREYMQPYNVAYFYVPHWDPSLSLQEGVPATPDQWRPSCLIRSGLEENPGWSGNTPIIYDSVIVNDPPFRMWRNKTSYISRWKVTFNQTDVDPVARVSVEAKDAASEAAYGPRSGDLDTSLVSHYVGTPVENALELANMWLARTHIPAWQIDSITINFEPGPMADQGIEETWWASWTPLMQFGPGQVGRIIYLQLDAGQPVRKAFLEGMSITHTELGWSVELSISPPVFYDALLTTRIMGPIQVNVYGPSVTLPFLYVTQYDDLTRVTGGTVTQGGNTWTVTGNGDVMPVTISGLVVGDNAITLTYNPPAGATYAGTTRNATIVRKATDGAWHDKWTDHWEKAA